MKNILMLLSNAFRPDPRVSREASTLSKQGYRVKLIVWDRQAELEPLEITDGYEIERIQSVRTKYGAGVKQILYLPQFWLAAIRKTKTFQPDIVHCHDLDTLIAGVFIKLRFGAALIYDAHEDYPALMSLYLPGIFIQFLRIFERWLLQYVDHTITASTLLAEKFFKSGVADVTTLGNVQNLSDYDCVKPAQIQSARSELGITENELLVAYIGGFSRNRLILPLIEALKELDNVQLCIWGDGHQREEVEQALYELSNIRYLGWLTSNRLPIMMQTVDVIVYLLKEDYPGAIYNAPNTLSQAMAASRPIICNRVGDLGRIVSNTGCGILLDSVDPLAIRNAILTLKNPELRRTLGSAGRKAAEKTYNWETVTRTLMEIYKGLLTQKQS